MSINEERIKLFRSDLEKAFAVIHLNIEDESHLHAGHAGAASRSEEHTSELQSH